ncbi:Fe/S biogenesis protein nfuA [Candidatus Blochmanniella vafra str. BVAF]|uniref:Fe/S biogenesis protein NfuA n=2 Tax=Candidatus Blochmanniella vafra TaxID=251535 RepID=E8Q6I4_BLOVB|nr:Fe/S biogenesis protein nfuA [Candidatus Blochmannia vafer str. BVAF]
MLYITKAAQQYLAELLKKQNTNTHIRLSVTNPGTLHAQCNLHYYTPKQNDSYNYLKIQFNQFAIYLEKIIAPFIQNTQIDIITDDLRTQITIQSPNLTNSIDNPSDNINKKITNNSSLTDRIKYVITQQINPQLAMHGGSVSLIKVNTDGMAILQFHGGCNGCSMALYTIKEGIEKTLKKFFPELKGVIDSTSHQRGKHSFY